MKLFLDEGLCVFFKRIAILDEDVEHQNRDSPPTKRRHYVENIGGDLKPQLLDSLSILFVTKGANNQDRADIESQCSTHVKDEVPYHCCFITVDADEVLRYLVDLPE